MIQQNVRSVTFAIPNCLHKLLEDIKTSELSWQIWIIKRNSFFYCNNLGKWRNIDVSDKIISGSVYKIIKTIKFLYFSHPRKIEMIFFCIHVFDLFCGSAQSYYHDKVEFLTTSQLRYGQKRIFSFNHPTGLLGGPLLDLGHQPYIIRVRLLLTNWLEWIH